MMLKKLYDFFTSRVVYHLLFWLGLLFILTIIELLGSSQPFFFTLGNNLIRLFIFCIIVYFNIIYLIPRYLAKKKFLVYSALLVLSAIIITPLEELILYFKFVNVPEAQVTLLRDLNWSFMPNFFVAGSSTLFKIISDWVRHLREQQELQTQTMQSELRFLKSQINPHFLFNTLNNLYALTLKKSDKAPEIVVKLSEMMRYMLYECNERRVELSKEVNYLRNYLDLERLRQGEKVEIHFDMKGVVGNQKIAPLMFIPFLENSFKHGLNHHLSKGFVNIRLRVEKEMIHLFIENSKPRSLPKITHRRSGGIGLVNVRRRLDILYPGQYELNIRDQPDAYAVDLKIELD